MIISTIQFTNAKKQEKYFYDEGFYDEVSTDRFGIKQIFYYIKDKEIVVSDNFWEIVKILKPEEENIDWFAIKCLASTNSFAFYRTILKDVKILSPSSTIKIKERKIERYWEFKYVPDYSLTMDKIVDEIDNILTRHFKKLKEKYPDKTFGLGLSGGKDSRVILKYALDNKLKIKIFAIAQKRGNFIFKPITYYIRKAILKELNFKNHIEIKPDTDSIVNKYYHEMLTPNNTSHVEIANYESLPKFDVYLSGNMGLTLLGKRCKKKLLRTNDLIGYCINLISFLPQNKLKEFFTEEEEKLLKKEYQKAIYDCDEKTNYRLFFRWWINYVHSNSFGGFFEGLRNTKPSECPFFCEELMEYSLKWPTEFLVGENLLQHYMIKKMPNLAKIMDELTDAPIYYKTDTVKGGIKRLLYGILAKILGSSYQRDEWVIKNKKLTYAAEKIKALKNEEFDKRFNLDKIKKPHPRIYSGLLKFRLITYLILNKKYDNFKEFLGGFFK